jgi:hypothetical protein
VLYAKAASACFDCLAVGGTLGPLTDSCNIILVLADLEVGNAVKLTILDYKLLVAAIIAS